MLGFDSYYYRIVRKLNKGGKDEVDNDEFRSPELKPLESTSDDNNEGLVRRIVILDWSSLYPSRLPSSRPSNEIYTSSLKYINGQSSDTDSIFVPSVDPAKKTTQSNQCILSQKRYTPRDKKDKIYMRKQKKLTNHGYRHQYR